MAHSVLIVDDSLTVRMDLDRVFRAGGFAPRLCATGAQARAALAERSWDVAVLDVHLADADGVELLRELRAAPAHRDTVVVLLSSEAEVQDRVRGLRTGADEYVGKPYDGGYVVARARQLLRARADGVPDRPTVLVIDDSATYRELLSRHLAGEGYAVVRAASGEEGLRLAADRRPDAIVVDGILPGIDGPTVIRQVRLDAALRDTPCLLLTGSDDEGAELRTLEAGADAFVRKQVDLSVVLAKLATVLRQRTGLPAAPAAASMHGPTKVLLVDPDPDRRRRVADAVRSDGYEAVPAATVGDALTLLAAQPVDCVVADVESVGAHCVDTVRRIRSVPGAGDVPVVVTGACPDDAAVVACLAAGADHYVRRAGGPDVLRANIRSQIRRKQSRDEARRVAEESMRAELVAAEARAARELADTRADLVARLTWRNEELDAFTGSVTHDLRAPLQVITLLAEELLDGGAADDDAGRAAVRRIHTAAVRMSELVDSLLLLSRASRGELRREPVDLSAQAREVAEELRRRNPDRDVEVAVADGMVAFGDPGLLRVVLENLMGNAWKFTGRTPRARVEVGWVRRGDRVEYFVRDNGVGFPRADAERVFRPFQRTHDSKEFPGTGIGLTTVHRIVDRHAGTIRADSEPGKGSVFTFTLPAAPDGNPPAAAD